MKNSISITIILFLFITTVSTKAHSQVKGNGDIIVKESSLSFFSQIENGLSSNITVELGGEPRITVKIDENLLPYIDVEIIDDVLTINQAEWISSTYKIEITITAPELTRFSNSAHGRHYILGIDTESFQLMSPVGDVTVTGKVKNVSIATGTGTMNAFGLESEKANVKVWSFGTIYINADQEIHADVSDNGKIVYAEEPVLLKQKTKEGGKVISKVQNDAPAKEIAYVNVKVKNNSDSRVHVEIKGPESARFGYGAPFNSFQTRKERFPVGTKIYLKRTFLKDKLLVEIKESDAGETVNLF